jgi:hypothetical protein
MLDLRRLELPEKLGLAVGIALTLVFAFAVGYGGDELHPRAFLIVLLVGVPATVVGVSIGHWFRRTFINR